MPSNRAPTPSFPTKKRKQSEPFIYTLPLHEKLSRSRVRNESLSSHVTVNPIHEIVQLLLLLALASTSAAGIAARQSITTINRKDKALNIDHHLWLVVSSKNVPFLLLLLLLLLQFRLKLSSPFESYPNEENLRRAPSRCFRFANFHLGRVSLSEGRRLLIPR